MPNVKLTLELLAWVSSFDQSLQKDALQYFRYYHAQSQQRITYSLTTVASMITLILEEQEEYSL